MPSDCMYASVTCGSEAARKAPFGLPVVPPV